MSAVEKTKKLNRLDIDVELLDNNELNPNEMSEAQFNMLYDNVERVGITDPILVRPHPSKKGRYRVVGGHHRLEVAKLLGFDTIPATVISDPEFDEDAEKFQVVRHNIIHGQMNADKFMALYNSLSEKYADDVAAELFGFTDEAEFKKLIKATEKSLPKDMKQAFKDAAKEIRTMDDLAKVLNYLFTTHGDTLPHGYMIVDFGGKESVWLRMQTGQKKTFLQLAAQTKAANKSMDHLMHKLLESLDEETVAALLAECPDVEGTFTADVPTLDFLN
jgi:ParB/RepB/Spo0J family partition protein